MPADNIVTIHANAVAKRTRGTWVASLAFGEHRRVEAGTETGVDLERTQLLAVVRALDCLTRPSLVRIVVSSSYVLHGIAAQERPSDTNGDLWWRLERADRVHRLTWVRAADTDPAFAEVTELAGTALVESLAGPSVGSVVREFLGNRESRVSADALAKYEGVVVTLNWAGSREIGELDDVPAAEVIALLPEFFWVLVHKEFASIAELRDARTVLTALLRWFGEHGHLDDATMKSQIQDVKNRIAKYIDVRRFVDALQEFVEATDHQVDLNEAEESVTEEYLRVIDVTPTSITFADWSGEEPPVGPIELPPEVAALGRPGWQVLLSAAVVDGEWFLVSVSNGDT